jgi:hypothetical protein
MTVAFLRTFYRPLTVHHRDSAAFLHSLATELGVWVFGPRTLSYEPNQLSNLREGSAI